MHLPLFLILYFPGLVYSILRIFGTQGKYLEVKKSRQEPQLACDSKLRLKAETFGPSGYKLDYARFLVETLLTQWLSVSFLYSSRKGRDMRKS